MSGQSSVASAHALTQRPRPYGVTKNGWRPNKRSTSTGSSRKAIDGRPATGSMAANVFAPALNTGCPQDSVSRASGSARHSRRTRSQLRAESPNRARSLGKAAQVYSPRL